MSSDRIEQQLNQRTNEADGLQNDPLFCSPSKPTLTAQEFLRLKIANLQAQSVEDIPGEHNSEKKSHSRERNRSTAIGIIRELNTLQPIVSSLSEASSPSSPIQQRLANHIRESTVAGGAAQDQSLAGARILKDLKAHSRLMQERSDDACAILKRIVQAFPALYKEYPKQEARLYELATQLRELLSLLETKRGTLDKSARATLRQHQSSTLDVQAFKHMTVDSFREESNAPKTPRPSLAINQKCASYFRSDEYKAVMLLGALQENPGKTTDFSPVEQAAARQLLDLGAERVVDLLSNLNPLVTLGPTDLIRLELLFDSLTQAGTKQSSSRDSRSETVPRDTPQGAQKTGQKPIKQGVQQTVEKVDGDTPIVTPEITEEPVEWKALLLEDLGLVDPVLRERLASNLTTAGIEIIIEAFRNINPEVVKAILKENPNLLNPGTGINLNSFINDLRTALSIPVDISSHPIFDPLHAPKNFSDPEVVKRTARAATILLDITRQVDRSFGRNK